MQAKFALDRTTRICNSSNKVTVVRLGMHYRHAPN